MKVPPGPRTGREDDLPGRSPGFGARIWEELAADLNGLDVQGLRRRLVTVEGPAGAEIVAGGRRLVNFASNNYLGLASDPRVVAAAVAGLARWGAGAGGSRLTSGNQGAYEALEASLADWKGCESAVVFASGYAAACGTIPALAGEGDAVCADRLNHASLIDGCRLSRAKLLVFPHADAGALDGILARHRAAYGRVLVVTDGVFSMDGDVAPLPELLAVAERHDATVVVDDAHASGVLGDTGAGTAEHFGLDNPERLVQLGTLSKALGSVGGYAVGPAILREWLVNRARTLVYSTALPASCLEAARAAIPIAREAHGPRARLRVLSGKLRSAGRALGYVVPEGGTPIVPLLLGESARAVRWHDRLAAAGSFVPGIRPPTVPLGTARLRVSLMADHTDSQLACLLDGLAVAAAGDA